MTPGMDWLPEQLGLQADVCNRGAAVEADAIGEQLAIREQQLKGMQSENSRK